MKRMIAGMTLPLAAGVALLTPSAAQAAPAPAAAPAWQYISTYVELSQCEAKGQRMLNAGQIAAWACEHDSPVYTLWGLY